MTKRIITVVLEVEDAEEANVIWKCHLLGQEKIAGCKVVTIANGDYVKTLDAIDKVLEDETNNACLRLIDKIDDAIKNTRGYLKNNP